MGATVGAIPALCMAACMDAAEVMSTNCMGMASAPSALMMGMYAVVTVWAFNAARSLAAFVGSVVAAPVITLAITFMAHAIWVDGVAGVTLQAASFGSFSEPALATIITLVSCLTILACWPSMIGSEPLFFISIIGLMRRSTPKPAIMVCTVAMA